MRVTRKKKRKFRKVTSALMAACIIFSTFSSSISAYAASNELIKLEQITKDTTVNSGEAVNTGEIHNHEYSEDNYIKEDVSEEESTDTTVKDSSEDFSSEEVCTDETCTDKNKESSESDKNEKENENSVVQVEEDEEQNDDSEKENKEEEEFLILGVIAPDKDIVSAEIGEKVTLKSKLNRENVKVAYQWQKIYEETDSVIPPNALHDYSQGIPTSYSFVLAGITESEYLKKNPEATWPGIETYKAIVCALDEIGKDSSNVSVEWNTKNFALDGFIISAAEKDGKIEIYAEKDGERHIGKLNKDGKWSFGDAKKYSATWQDIDGATKDEYIFYSTLPRNA